MKRAALVYFDLTVLRKPDREPLQGTGGRSFEVDTIPIETAAMTGALELPLTLQPDRRATQVRADGLQGVNLPLTFKLIVYDPCAVLSGIPRLDLPKSQFLGRTCPNRIGGSSSTLGSMNRKQPNNHSRLDAASVQKPTANGDRTTDARKRRRRDRSGGIPCSSRIGHCLLHTRHEHGCPWSSWGSTGAWHPIRRRKTSRQCGLFSRSPGLRGAFRHGAASP